MWTILLVITTIGFHSVATTSQQIGNYQSEAACISVASKIKVAPTPKFLFESQGQDVRVQQTAQCIQLK